MSYEIGSKALEREFTKNHVITAVFYPVRKTAMVYLLDFHFL